MNLGWKSVSRQDLINYTPRHWKSSYWTQKYMLRLPEQTQKKREIFIEIDRNEELFRPLQGTD